MNGETEGTIPLGKAQRQLAQSPPPGDSDDDSDDPCPVVCLGQRHGSFFFIAASGELRELTPRDMTATGLLALFNGDNGWLKRKFPRRDGEGTPLNDFVNKSAAAGLMRRCAAAGLWSSDTPIRGVGVWAADKAEDGIIVHAGDALLSAANEEPEWIAAGRRFGKAIYPAAPPLERPADEPASAGDAKALLAAIALWNFTDAAAPKMVLGWMTLAMLGAAPAWRVHFLVRGERGSGKSLLTKLVATALGPQARKSNDFTEAGLRQLLTGEGRALVLDEAEGDPSQNRVEQVIVFLRKLAGDEGVDSYRGSASGKSQHFTVACSAWLSAINAPALLPQDRSRIYDAAMLAANGANRAKAIAAVAAAASSSSALRARAIDGWQVFLEDLVIYHDELMAAGCDPRQADKFGTLLAAAEMMLSDETVDREAAAGEVATLAAAIAEMIAEDKESSDAQQCFTTMMTRQVEHWQGGSKSTIGRLVQGGLDSVNQAARDALKVYGLRLDLNSGNPRLLVANMHEGLRAIFRDTRWREGGWKSSLLRLDGASIGAEPVRFDGHKSRCIVIPAAHLPPPPRPRPPVEQSLAEEPERDHGP